MNEKDIIQPAPVDAENATTPTPDTPAVPAAETTTPAPAAGEAEPLIRLFDQVFV